MADSRANSGSDFVSHFGSSRLSTDHFRGFLCRPVSMIIIIDKSAPGPLERPSPAVEVTRFAILRKRAIFQELRNFADIRSASMTTTQQRSRTMFIPTLRLVFALSLLTVVSASVGWGQEAVSGRVQQEAIGSGRSGEGSHYGQYHDRRRGRFQDEFGGIFFLHAQARDAVERCQENRRPAAAVSQRDHLYAELASSNSNQEYIVLLAIARGIGKRPLYGGMTWSVGDDWVWQFRKVGKRIQVVIVATSVSRQPRASRSPRP